MKRLRFNQAIIIILITLSAIFFVLQLLVFNNAEESGFLFFQDLMFLPLHILLVTFILDRVLRGREKRERLQQIHIVISAFFSEAGTDTLRGIGELITDKQQLAEKLDMKQDWGVQDFDKAAETVKNHAFTAAPDARTLKMLRESLPRKKSYLLQMFSNPNLLEHDTFTDMLWAVYHLTDELENREDFSMLPESDLKHLAGDITRAYGLLAFEWVQHMRYLKERYPYLWSIAVRKNPFAENSIVVR
jgi:hypothetical protein